MLLCVVRTTFLWIFCPPCGPLCVAIEDAVRGRCGTNTPKLLPAWLLSKRAGVEGEEVAVDEKEDEDKFNDDANGVFTEGDILWSLFEVS